MLTLGIEYLTGYAVATSTGDRTLPEWPPHPGRIFMALAAAYFETRPDPSEGPAVSTWEKEADALRWLERQDAPKIFATECDRRSVVEVYVKPNDFSIFDERGKPRRIPDPFEASLSAKQKQQQVSGIKDLLQIFPSFRNGKERTFPRVRPHQSTVFLQWPNRPSSPDMRVALERLCAKVIRIGHSSSMVRMWVEENELPASFNWIPEEHVATSRTAGSVERLRVVSEGCLDYLRDQYNGEAVDRFYDFTVRMQASKGKEQKRIQAEFEEVFGVAWKNRKLPSSRRPVLSMTHPYCISESPTTDSATPVQSVFDDQLLILDKREGPVLGLESTWQLLSALRGAIEKAASPSPEWISGHQADGRPSEKPHLALFPLGFVGHDHADGHLLGVALAFPRNIPLNERGKLVGRLLYDATGMPKDLCLTMGRLGVWTLGEEQRPAPPQALRARTWTGPSKVWASVSPVVLDKHPKIDPRKDRGGYLAEVAVIVSASCRRIGLPDPAEIDIDKTSWHRGAPQAKPGPDGFPLMPQRPNGPNRRQVHVWLRFDQPVIGPILLGSGRYRGYGLCKPWKPQT